MAGGSTRFRASKLFRGRRDVHARVAAQESLTAACQRHVPKASQVCGFSFDQNSAETWAGNSAGGRRLHIRRFRNGVQASDGCGSRDGRCRWMCPSLVGGRLQRLDFAARGALCIAAIRQRENRKDQHTKQEYARPHNHEPPSALQCTLARTFLQTVFSNWLCLCWLLHGGQCFTVTPSSVQTCS